MHEDCKPTQRLVHLEVLAKPLKGIELAQTLMTCIAVNHSFGPLMVFAGMKVGAAVNGALIQSVMWNAILYSEIWTHFSATG